ncbi:hypothetical protein FB451DRAFT_1223836, partial [Mycena latifolia]
MLFPLILPIPVLFVLMLPMPVLFTLSPPIPIPELASKSVFSRGGAPGPPLAFEPAGSGAKTISATARSASCTRCSVRWWPRYIARERPGCVVSSEISETTPRPHSATTHPFSQHSISPPNLSPISARALVRLKSPSAASSFMISPSIPRICACICASKSVCAARFLCSGPILFSFFSALSARASAALRRRLSSSSASSRVRIALRCWGRGLVRVRVRGRRGEEEKGRM